MVNGRTGPEQLVGVGPELTKAGFVGGSGVAQDAVGHRQSAGHDDRRIAALNHRGADRSSAPSWTSVRNSSG